MSNTVIERKGCGDELCFYEKFRRTVYDVVSGGDIRFVEMEKLARSYVDENWDRYRKLLEEEEDPDKYGLLGNMFRLGRGVEKDVEKAVELYRKGMNLGSGYAATEFGNTFWLGQGVERSYEKAVEMFRKGIKMGSGFAAGNLGYAFWIGQGVEQSAEKAAEMFRKGVDMESGYSASCFGNFFWNGKGVEQSNKKAVEMFRKGMEMGDDYARRRLKNILVEMDEISDEILDMLWDVDGLPIEVENLVLERKMRLVIDKNDKQERELKKLQLERSNAGKVLGGNLCGVISDFI